MYYLLDKTEIESKQWDKNRRRMLEDNLGHKRYAKNSRHVTEAI